MTQRLVSHARHHPEPHDIYSMFSQLGRLFNHYHDCKSIPHDIVQVNVWGSLTEDRHVERGPLAFHCLNLS